MGGRVSWQGLGILHIKKAFWGRNLRLGQLMFALGQRGPLVGLLTDLFYAVHQLTIGLVIWLTILTNPRKELCMCCLHGRICSQPFNILAFDTLIDQQSLSFVPTTCYLTGMWQRQHCFCHYIEIGGLHLQESVQIFIPCIFFSLILSFVFQFPIQVSSHH